MRAIGSSGWGHFRHPGAPARVASQEKGSARRCPVHDVGYASDVIIREGRSSRQLRLRRRRVDTAARAQRGAAATAPPRAARGTAPFAGGGSGSPSSRIGECAPIPWEAHGAEPADELFDGQRHLSLLAAMGVVLPAKRDLPVFHPDQAVVRDGDAVSVAGQVMQHVLRPAEGLLHVDDPLMLKERLEEARERARLLEPSQRSVESEFVAAEETLQAVVELAAEDLAEYLLRQEDSRALGTPPAGAARGEAPGRYDAMDMRMVDERLPPGMQDAQEADLCAQSFRVRRHL